MTRHVVIVGGVAGGASAAARLRRLDENLRITLIERGPYVSFANCGLPYHIGGEIADRNKLLLHTPESLSTRFAISVRTKTTAEKILPEERVLHVRSAAGSEALQYDELILATGAAPFKPPLPGIDGTGVFTLRDISDMDAIIHYLKTEQVKKAVVVGGGFIGVEVAEQLAEHGTDLVLVDGSSHVIPPLDPEMAAPLNAEIREHMQLELGARLEAISLDENARATGAVLSNGKELAADMLVLGLGVRPEIGLAKEAGAQIGKLGGIATDEFLQTSVDHVWAIGDAIEVQHIVSKQPALIALAGPANRQGRLVADNIVMPAKKAYRGTLGTAIVRVFSKTAAATGLNESSLKELGMRYKKLYLFPKSHAGYFPGAQVLNIKILFDPETRRVLGAQIVGEDGVDKRIDVLATAIKGGLSIDDIADLELSYAPPYGSAKDPVNMIGMAAQNVADGLVDVVSPDDIGGFILDVRSKAEFEGGAVPGAVNIPLDELRERLSELPSDAVIQVYCLSGQRSYNATRILSQAGLKAINVTGAYKAYTLFQQV